MSHDIIRVYNSIQEFSASLNRETNKVFKGAELRSDIPDKNGFKGTPDFETADKYLKYGDSENLSRIQAVRVQGSNKSGTEIRSRQCNGVVGSVPNVANYLKGVPNCMIRKERQRFSNSSKVINICYNCTTDGTVKGHTVAEESAKLLSIVSAAEKQGYRVGISVLVGAAVRTKSGKERIFLSVKVKDPGQYLDIRKLAYILVNPSFLRRHYFRLTETDPDLTQSYWNIGYGFVLDDSDMKEVIKGIPSLKDSKYLSFEMIRGKNDKEIQRMII